MNRVGHEGRGESVWLGWFLVTVLNEFAPLCERRGRADLAQHVSRRGAMARAACWNWRGTATGIAAPTSTTGRRSDRRRTRSASSTRSRNPGPCCRGRRSPAAPSGPWTPCARNLVRRDAQLVLLLTPPFDRMTHDPGLHQGLPARHSRERRAVHARRALDRDCAGAPRAGRRGDGAVPHAQPDQPHAHARKAPSGTARSPTSWPPMSTRIPMHVGRGGWTWYTGSAGWMYQAAVQACWACAGTGTTFSVNPCIPSVWPELFVRVEGGRHAVSLRGHQSRTTVSRGLVGGARRRSRRREGHPAVGRWGSARGHRPARAGGNRPCKPFPPSSRRPLCGPTARIRFRCRTPGRAWSGLCSRTA